MRKQLTLTSALLLVSITTLSSQNTSYILNTAVIGGVRNTSFGNPGLNPATTGGDNTSTGYRGLFANTSGNYNTANGTESLFNNTIGSENSGIGYRALWANTSGSFNSGNGVGILYLNTTGSRNTADGWLTMYNNSTGSNNSAEGYKAMFNNTTGSFNTALGSGADVGIGGLNNATAIGANAKVMNSNNIILGDNSAAVGIGLSGNVSGPQAGLHSVHTNKAIKGEASGPGGIGMEGSGQTGALGLGTQVGLDGVGGLAGVRGQSYGSANVGLQYGVQGFAGQGATNYGGYFQGNVSSSVSVTYGVYARVFQPNLGGTNYGIYSTVGGNNNSGAGPNYAGYFNGDVVTAGGFFFYSDKRIKKDIAKINNSMSVIKKLNPVNYNFDLEGNTNFALPSEKQYGFISQEVQQIIPEFTKTLIHPAKIDEDGKEVAPQKEVLGLNYIGFIALLTKGMQEQQDLIENLTEKVGNQEQLIAELTKKSSNSTGINNLQIETGFQMSQNEPNPFTHETLVKYTLPTSVANAFMAVYDLTGKQITTFPIEQKGSSSLTITSEKLAAGIYIYSIVADGKVVDSKRMIVANK